jgi:hypothetical protein
VQLQTLVDNLTQSKRFGSTNKENG